MEGAPEICLVDVAAPCVGSGDSTLQSADDGRAVVTRSAVVFTSKDPPLIPVMVIFTRTQQTFPSSFPMTLTVTAPAGALVMRMIRMRRVCSSGTSQVVTFFLQYLATRLKLTRWSVGIG